MKEKSKSVKAISRPSPRSRKKKRRKEGSSPCMKLKKPSSITSSAPPSTSQRSHPTFTGGLYCYEGRREFDKCSRRCRSATRRVKKGRKEGDRSSPSRVGSKEVLDDGLFPSFRRRGRIHPSRCSRPVRLREKVEERREGWERRGKEGRRTKEGSARLSPLSSLIISSSTLHPPPSLTPELLRCRRNSLSICMEQLRREGSLFSDQKSRRRSFSPSAQPIDPSSLFSDPPDFHGYRDWESIQSRRAHRKEAERRPR